MTGWPYEPTPYDDSFRKYGQQYGVDPGLLRTMAQIESNFNPRAVSSAGARGLMQFMENTGPDYGLHSESDYYDPDKSIHAGAQYVSKLYDRFGDWDQARAAYNMGPGKLSSLGGDWSGVPESVEYNRRFHERYKPEVGEFDHLAKSVADLVGEFDYLAKPQERGKVGEFDYLAQPREKVGREYENPYPMGSREYFEYGRSLGMQPAIRSSTELEGEPIQGTTVPQGGNWGGDLDAVYPTQYKARLVRHMDADTMEVEEMGTGERFPLRFADIQAPETGTHEGELAREYIKLLVEPGEQLTIESKPGWQGKYGPRSWQGLRDAQR